MPSSPTSPSATVRWTVTRSGRGARICVSPGLGLNRYRAPFLDGFLLATVRGEKRYRTVERLFQRGLLTGAYEEEAAEATACGALPKEAASAMEAVPDVVGWETPGAAPLL